MLFEIAGGILLALAVLWLLKWAVVLLFILPAEHRAAAQRADNKRRAIEANAESEAKELENQATYARLQAEYDQRVSSTSGSVAD